MLSHFAHAGHDHAEASLEPETVSSSSKEDVPTTSETKATATKAVAAVPADNTGLFVGSIAVGVLAIVVLATVIAIMMRREAVKK